MESWKKAILLRKMGLLVPCERVSEKDEAGSGVPTAHRDDCEQAFSYCTSMISVCACLVQKACGGVVQLTATKLVGLRSRVGVTSSLQAATFKHRRRLQTAGFTVRVGCH